MMQNYDMDLEVEDAPMFIQGERALLVAILERTFFDLYAERERGEAVKWLSDKSATEHDLFTFPWICTQLDFDLVKWQQKANKIIKETTNERGVLARLSKGISIKVPRNTTDIRRRPGPSRKWEPSRQFPGGEVKAA